MLVNFICEVPFGVQGVTRFRAKIGDANVASQKLFLGLGFVQTGRSEVFQEVTLELAGGAGVDNGGTDTWRKLVDLGARLRRGCYDCES